MSDCKFALVETLNAAQIDPVVARVKTGFDKGMNTTSGTEIVRGCFCTELVDTQRISWVLNGDLFRRKYEITQHRALAPTDGAIAQHCICDFRDIECEVDGRAMTGAVIGLHRSAFTLPGNHLSLAKNLNDARALSKEKRGARCPPISFATQAHSLIPPGFCLRPECRQRRAHPPRVRFEPRRLIPPEALLFRRGRTLCSPIAPCTPQRGAALVSYSPRCPRRCCISCRCRCAPACSFRNRHRDRLRNPASSPWREHPSVRYRRRLHPR